MSRGILGCIAGVAFGAALVPGAALAQQSFPLSCRGGGGMVATVTTDVSVRITFTPTSQATGGAPPAAGECGWFDRGFREGEPALLLYTGAIEGIRFLVENMVMGAPFIIHVYNDGQGSMVVTRFGP